MTTTPQPVQEPAGAVLALRIAAQEALDTFSMLCSYADSADLGPTVIEEIGDTCDQLRAALASLQPVTQAKSEAETRINAKGDWRPIRDALEEAYKRLGRVPGSGGYPQQDWNLAVLMYEAAAAHRDTAPCIHCSKRIAWPDAYRCLDCRGVLCERCAPEHFGPKHADRAVAAHPATSTDNLIEEAARVMREAIDARRNQDI